MVNTEPVQVIEKLNRLKIGKAGKKDPAINWYDATGLRAVPTAGKLAMLQ